MDFALSEEQVAMADMARGFAREAIAPHARDWEAAGTNPPRICGSTPRNWVWAGSTCRRSSAGPG